MKLFFPVPQVKGGISDGVDGGPVDIVDILDDPDCELDPDRCRVREGQHEKETDTFPHACSYLHVVCLFTLSGCCQRRALRLGPHECPARFPRVPVVRALAQALPAVPQGR